ncbi:MAG: hypothetical protein KQI35_08760 [Bacteroidetes bacterium]|nr:hypothetical protein [Bacteroidota bacterium]
MQPTHFTSQFISLNFLFILLWFVSCTEKETIHNTSNCNHTDIIDSIYREDTQRLLFMEIYADSMHEDRNQPFFDEGKVNLILNAFQAVYYLDIPERDSIVEKYNIHVFPWLGMQSISLQVDTAALEVMKLIQEKPTGNAKLDIIIHEYNFTDVQPSLYYPEFNWITITAEQPLNLLPIMEELASLPVFYQVGLGGGAVGDGNTIELSQDGLVLKLDFSIGWGDCPSGCLYRKHWIFVVDDQCNATFLHTY